MSRTVFGIVAALAALSAGCVEEPQPQLQPQSQPATRPATQASRPAWRIPRGVVADAIDSVGGLADWRKVGQVSYDAVIAIHDRDGQSHVNCHQHVLNVQRWTLTTKARRPQGAWYASVAPDGKCSFNAPDDVLDSASRARLARSLPMVKHRLVGPLNLCATRELPGAETKMSVNGIDVIRVNVEGDRRNAAAYYFDATSGRLRFVTTGDDKPGGRGTITVYGYGGGPGGVQLPESIVVLRFGEHVLFGTEKVLEVDLKNVKFYERLPYAASRPATAPETDNSPHW